MTDQPADAVVATACERLCSDQQRAVVACVNSLRDAAAGASGGSDYDDDDGIDPATTNAAASPTSAIDANRASCLSGAVMAWTRCCEEANIGQV